MNSKLLKKLSETTLKSEVVFSSQFLKINRDEVEQSDGSLFFREYIEHPGASLVVPILPDGRLLFIQQYRHALKQIFIEFPAGKKDPHENFQETAHRELLEETGYNAKTLEFMCTLHPVIGYSDERIDCFLATNLSLQKTHRDPGENMELLPLEFENALQLLHAGKITDTKTMVSLLWYSQWLIKTDLSTDAVF